MEDLLNKPDTQAVEPEDEYEAWDWARTAGVSGEELRKAVEKAGKRSPQT